MSISSHRINNNELKLDNSYKKERLNMKKVDLEQIVKALGMALSEKQL